MIWRDDQSNLDSVAYEMLRNKKKVNAKCCSKPTIHIYAEQDRDDRQIASAWIWCGACGSFSHLDGLPIHSTWENCKEINSDDLTAVPGYLAEHEETVDQHLALFLRK